MNPVVKEVFDAISSIVVLSLSIVATGYLFGLGFHTAHKRTFRWEVSELSEVVGVKEGGKVGE